MNQNDFTTTITVDQSPQQVFDAINNVRAWWSEEVEGNSNQLNSSFNYHYEDVHRCQMKIIELDPGKKVVWLVEDNYFNFTKDEKEWIGDTIIFNISEKDDKTQMIFTHQGLVPEYECYDACYSGWSNYIQNSLYALITTGTGKPNAKGRPQTKFEEELGENGK